MAMISKTISLHYQVYWGVFRVWQQEIDDRHKGTVAQFHFLDHSGFSSRSAILLRIALFGKKLEVPMLV